MKDKGTQVIEKNKKERFETMPTFSPEIKLKLEPGTKLDSSQAKAFKPFYDLAKDYVKKHWKIYNLNKKKEGQKKEIINMAKKNDGFRGVISEKDSFNLTVSPSEKVTWDQKKLKESLKDQYPLAVRETKTITVTVPNLGSSDKDEKIIEKAIRKALAKSRVGGFWVNCLINKKISIEVDEKKLNKIIADNKIKLPSKTKKVEVTWKVRVDPLKS